ncbi:HupE/UreJ family protein [Pseudooceanicola sp. CBS1P-1]|uniref:Urease accessory protein n=1 Tax=Pseudooceanicola albus TaxID=2692189 RepID=A0A6L7FZE7_9RHOB|nr:MULTISPECIES: HupE/UreJ family protein [Pseudooceanicola]MBT9383619.1 HupE/UreJ family protein [Pseudooceanicola endophyticus]MXN17474.1 urease accessory protein [Pseudooceanicola albus]
MSLSLPRSLPPSLRSLPPLALFLMLAGAQSASAHIVPTGSGGLSAGFEHPFTGYDHFLAMFSVGLWGAQMGGRRVWTLPVTFPMVMVIGGIVGIAGLQVPGIETGIALSILVLGAAIALAWKPQEWASLAIIGFFALCHGYAHGAELPLAANPADYAVGFVVATGLIHVIGVGVGLLLGPLWQGRICRLLGGVIALCGIGYLVA